MDGELENNFVVVCVFVLFSFFATRRAKNLCLFFCFVLFCFVVVVVVVFFFLGGGGDSRNLCAKKKISKVTQFTMS